MKLQPALANFLNDLDRREEEKGQPNYDPEEEKKLEEKDMKKRGEYWQKCYACLCYFRAKDAFTPYDCPHCHHSRYGD